LNFLFGFVISALERFKKRREPGFRPIIQLRDWIKRSTRPAIKQRTIPIDRRISQCADGERQTLSHSIGHLRIWIKKHAAGIRAVTREVYKWQSRRWIPRDKRQAPKREEGGICGEKKQIVILSADSGDTACRKGNANSHRLERTNMAENLVN
jgi:hypothetical protein